MGGFDVGVGSVHSQIAHASVVALVSCMPGAAASFSVPAATVTVMGRFVVAAALAAKGSATLRYAERTS